MEEAADSSPRRDDDDAAADGRRRDAVPEAADVLENVAEVDSGSSSSAVDPIIGASSKRSQRDSRRRRETKGTSAEIKDMHNAKDRATHSWV